MGRIFEVRCTSNSGNQVGIKYENINEWQKSCKDFKMTINAVVVRHSV